MVSKKLPNAVDLVDLPCDHYEYSNVSSVNMLEYFFMILVSFNISNFLNYSHCGILIILSSSRNQE